MIKTLISTIMAFIVSIIGILGLHGNIGEKPKEEGSIKDVTISFDNVDEFFDYTSNLDNLLSYGNKENGFEYSVYKDSFAVVENTTVNSRKMLIPETLGGYKVVAVCNVGYSLSVKEVVFSEGIEFISCPLKKIRNVEIVSLPASLKYIESGTLAKCKHLKEITLPELIDVVTSCLFSECSDLKSVKMGSKVEIIEGDAFFWCKSL